MLVPGSMPIITLSRLDTALSMSVDGIEQRREQGHRISEIGEQTRTEYIVEMLLETVDGTLSFCLHLHGIGVGLRIFSFPQAAYQGGLQAAFGSCGDIYFPQKFHKTWRRSLVGCECGVMEYHRLFLFTALAAKRKCRSIVAKVP